eukprot:TRINITY_DN11991_c1_g1_i1.p1 TRINITY_DN11991_c1_g1~~TRINITY_DN11991_c1_g1_i1.p1  ORF type:complete len:692 (+),score=144.81 TRINITY_DN11991_c1_g1_i1:255-2330(+)
MAFQPPSLKRSKDVKAKTIPGPADTTPVHNTTPPLNRRATLTPDSGDVATIVQAWGRLLPIHGLPSAVELVQPRLVIGRAADADLSLPNNAYVSSTHCVIERQDDNTVKLTDKSTNGVWLNGERLLKNNPVPVQHGDELKLTSVKPGKDHCLVIALQLLGHAKRAVAQDEAVTPLSKRSKKDKDASSTTAVPDKMDLTQADKDDKDDKQDKDLDGVDDTEAELTCAICREILHDAVSLLPCLHTFCAGCFSQWHERDATCPDCRVKVTKVQRNHTIRNLAEAYLRKHPDKKRPDDELADLDRLNKFTRDQVELTKTKKRRYDDYDASDNDYSNDYTDGSDTDDEDDEDDNGPDLACRACLDGNASKSGHACPDGTQHGHCRCCFQPMPLGNARPYPVPIALARVPALGQPVRLYSSAGGQLQGGFGATALAAPTMTTSATAPTATTAGTTAPTTATTAGTTAPTTATTTTTTGAPSTAAPIQTASTSNGTSNGTPTTTAASVDNSSTSCSTATAAPSVATQPVDITCCAMCGALQCAMFWTTGCQGPCQHTGTCLTPLKDASIRDAMLLRVINNNTFESKVLLDYAAAKSWTNQQLYADIMDRFKSGAITSMVQGLTVDTPVCRNCVVEILRPLAWLYREAIPKADLPPSATSKADGSRRDDCWYGYNCRTQFSRPHHAANFNHVCDPRPR